jgi:4a-hydroxytetrahydrobiopterin dehydratase
MKVKIVLLIRVNGQHPKQPLKQNLTFIQAPMQMVGPQKIINLKVVVGENVNNMKIIITESQKNRIMNNDNWEEVSGKLIKTFYFKNYTEVMSFTNEVMKIANKQNHHPDMTVHYDNVKLSIIDHDKGKVSDKCHKFANEVNKIK